MQQFFVQLYDGVRDAWGRLGRSARINIAVVGAAAVAALILLVVYNTRPQYETLYNGLSAEDSRAIRTYLDDEGVRYRVKHDGAEIEVTNRDRGRVMLALKDQGLPKTFGRVPGFELFDAQDLMTNRYLQDVNYMRALQGELQNTLNALEFVDNSFVMIREAEEAYFTDYQKPSTASVTLDLNRKPSAKEVEAVLSIISSFGGAELDRGNITLTATSGEPLYLPPTDEFVALAGSLHAHKLEVEREREAQLTEFFRKADVRAVFRVAAKVDRRRVSERSITSADGAVVSSSKLNTNIASNEAPPEGPAGLTENLPEDAQLAEGYRHQETTTETIENFEPSITETNTSTEPGDIESYSVAAFISGGMEPELDAEGNPTGNEVYRPLTDEDIDRFKNMIAAGVAPDVVIDDIVIADLPTPAQMPAAASPSLLTVEGFGAAAGRNGWLIVQLILLVVGFWMIRRLALRAIVPPQEELEEGGEEDLAQERVDIQREIIDRIERAAREQPDMVAAVLRSWITETREER